MGKLEYTMSEIVERMVNSLEDHARIEEKSLEGLTYKNFNTFLDKLFDDGGYARCELFTDIAWDYAFQFGKIESAAFDEAFHKCIKHAIKQIQKNLEKRNGNG